MRPHVPGVTMPVELNQNERPLIGEVERVIEQNGLRPTDRRDVEYQLAFSVEDSPVSATVTLDLYQGRNRIAHAYAKAGGARVVFQRQRAIREAFDKALQQFQPQLPRPGGFQRMDNYSDSNGRGTDEAQPYGSSSGSMQPYGTGPTPEPYRQGNDWQNGY